MLLAISLANDPTGHQIANWLKSFPPSNVKAVSIEALFLRNRILEGRLRQEEHEQSAFFPGSILGKISQSAQQEILERLRYLPNIVKKLDENIHKRSRSQ